MTSWEGMTSFMAPAARSSRGNPLPGGRGPGGRREAQSSRAEEEMPRGR
jgi:hypothetical protein